MKTGTAKYQAHTIVKRAGKEAVHIWADVRSFDFKWVVPYETAFSSKILRNPTTWVMLLFGFGPLVEFSLVPTLKQLMLCMVAYFALAWAGYFYVFVANRSTDLKLGVGTAGFTIFIGFQLNLLLSHVPPLSFFYGMIPANAGLERLVGYTLGVGIGEELVKAVPVLLLAFGMGRINKPLDGIFYGALSGLGFSVVEGSKFIGGAHNAAAVLGQTLLRTTTMPFLHAMWTAVSGYFIALAMVNRRRRTALCVLGITVAAVLHGCYDFAPEGIVTVGMAAFVYLLFISYIDRSQDMVRDLAEASAGVAEAVTSGATPAGGDLLRPWTA